MKYIRTKDSVQEIGIDERLKKEGVSNYYFYKWKDIKMLMDKNDVKKYKQADTIEELCDEFVFIDEFFKREHRLAYSLENALARCKYHDVDITTLRGAIWTDKGLIYVAKMNDKGNLELL